MKNKKYIMCSGLAFYDQEDMEMLHEYALKGWIFRELRFGLFYVLHREKPKDLVFSYDMCNVRKEEKEDYLELFSQAGWELIPKWDNRIRFFGAINGTTPVHSEKETRSEQYRTVMICAAVILAISLLLFGMNLIHNRFLFFLLASVLLGVGGILLLASLLRLKGKRLKINCNTYIWQIVKICIGVFLLWGILRNPLQLNLIMIFLVLVLVWLIPGSMYGCYRTYLIKNRK